MAKHLEAIVIGRDGEEISLFEGALTNKGIAELAIDENPSATTGNLATTILTVESAIELRNSLTTLINGWMES